MRTYNVHVDFISEEGAVLYSRTYPIIAESALMAETWVANILAVLEYQTSTLSDIFRQAGRTIIEEAE